MCTMEIMSQFEPSSLRTLYVLEHSTCTLNCTTNGSNTIDIGPGTLPAQWSQNQLTHIIGVGINSLLGWDGWGRGGGGGGGLPPVATPMLRCPAWPFLC